MQRFLTAGSFLIDVPVHPTPGMGDVVEDLTVTVPVQDQKMPNGNLEHLSLLPWETSLIVRQYICHASLGRR